MDLQKDGNITLIFNILWELFSQEDPIYKSFIFNVPWELLTMDGGTF